MKLAIIATLVASASAFSIKVPAVSSNLLDGNYSMMADFVADVLSVTPS